MKAYLHQNLHQVYLGLKPYPFQVHLLDLHLLVIDHGYIDITDHMTSSFIGLHSTKPSNQTHIISTNGITSQVMGKRSLSLTPSLNLNHVLVVLSLNYILLFVSQIIDSLNYTMCLWALYCLF